MNQTIHQWINPSINQSSNKSIRQSMNETLHQSISQSINPSTNKFINPSINDSINEWMNESIHQSINHPIDQWINPSIHQYINESIIQSGIYSACQFYKKIYTTIRGNYRRVLRPVCVSGGKCFCFFVDFACPGDHFGGNVGVLEHPEAPQRPRESDRERFCAKTARKV